MEQSWVAKMGLHVSIRQVLTGAPVQLDGLVSIAPKRQTAATAAQTNRFAGMVFV